MRAQPGNRFVSFVRGAARREIIVHGVGLPPGRFLLFLPPAVRGFWLIGSLARWLVVPAPRLLALRWLVALARVLVVAPRLARRWLGACPLSGLRVCSRAVGSGLVLCRGSAFARAPLARGSGSCPCRGSTFARAPLARWLVGSLTRWLAGSLARWLDRWLVGSC